MKPRLDGRAAIIDKTIIIADPHLGHTEQLPVGDPEEEYTQFFNRLTYLTDKHSATRIIIAGDVFDTFEFPPDEAINTVRKFKNFIEARGGELIVTPGNHDTDAIPWESGIVTEAIPEYRLDSTVILHGHAEPEETADLYIIGHLHPMIRIQTTKWPCYLFAEDAYNAADVLILPPFNDHSGGIAITPNSTPSINFPMATNFRNFKPIVWDDETQETREFPYLSQLDTHL